MTNWQRYLEWFEKKQLRCPARPDMRGLFSKGTITAFLPILRVYWRGNEHNPNPPFDISSWPRVADGYSRFFRADQALDWLHQTCRPAHDAKHFAEILNEALGVWLIPVDPPLSEYDFLLQRRVETVRLITWADDASGIAVRWSREPRLFPDGLRGDCPDGLDLVHTPESARAGLSRYLTVGTEVSDTGDLTGLDLTQPWGSSTIAVPYRLHTAPRRLMLGASLQSRAVALAADGDGWPPACPLRAVFSVCNGLTHEDAVVVSASAALKLTRADTIEVTVLVPAIAYWRLEVEHPGSRVEAGQALVRAWVDLYALGWRRRELRESSFVTKDGWVEIGLNNATAPRDATLVDVVHMRNLRTPRYREKITFKFAISTPLRVGDKVATPYGIKGVVSKIIDDDAMPSGADGPAEVLLSPVGIIRRGALGQFIEADSSGGTAGGVLPKTGIIRVMRQPQDAQPRCRMRGDQTQTGRGQRFGEMEFWALMAYGAGEIASELLSTSRSTARWVTSEQSLAGSQLKNDMKGLCRRALNRYFALVGLEIEDYRLHRIQKSSGPILVRAGSNSYVVAPSRYFTDIVDVLDHLEDWAWFEKKGGTIYLDLRRNPVQISIKGHNDGGAAREASVVFEAIPILPPWLRPAMASNAAGRTVSHPLTLHYRSTLKAACFGRDPRTRQDLQATVQNLLKAAFTTKYGAAAFLKREVLGRRLTRSARAVIIPSPDLKIDQIGLPTEVFDVLTSGLPATCREVVLVNRNPTLHRRGLLALRPKVLHGLRDVFALPLGVLSALGADFDGDQVSVTALEGPAACAEAVKLLPGSEGQRLDSYRRNRPAFPLLHELSLTAEEIHLARSNDLDQNAWCDAHADLVGKRLGSIGDGWDYVERNLEIDHELLRGLSLPEWRHRAQLEMDKIYAVREKGRKGGVLRRQVYRLPFTTWPSFVDGIGALQAITERLTQYALSVKTSKIVAAPVAAQPTQSTSEQVVFSATAFFRDPVRQAKQLASLDSTLNPDRISEALSELGEPSGLLAWFAKPDLATIVDLFAADEAAPSVNTGDPRLSWFLA
jgi:hypothetical protein